MKLIIAASLFPFLSVVQAWSTETRSSSSPRSWSKDRHPLPDPSRRSLVSGALYTSFVPFVRPSHAATDRLVDPILKQVQPSKRAILERPTPFPSFLEGTWNVQQVLTNVEFPLGLQFAGGPNGDLRIGQAGADEARARLQQPVSLQLRFVNDESTQSVVEDKLFNTQQRLDAFAGRRVVASVVPTTDTVTQRDTAILVRFRGPAVQKVFTTAHSETLNSIFECQRTLFALTNTSTAPPIATDTEVVYRFTQVDDRTVTGRLRIANYLIPTDRLYFDAQQRAVSLQDYDLLLRRED